MDLGLIFFFLSLAEGLSVLFIFSKHYLEFLKPTQYSLGRFHKETKHEGTEIFHIPPTPGTSTVSHY